MSDQEATIIEANRRTGRRGLTVLLWFAGGALAGAAAAYLAQAQNREHVRDLAHRARNKAGRVPKALRDASSAAHTAFGESYRGNSEPIVAVEPKSK